MSDPTAGGEPVPAPSVSTAPAEPAHRRRIPSHLGPARTSTVILAVLFVGVFALYLNVKPETVGTATTGGTGGVEQPADPSPTVDPTPTEPTPEPEPTPPDAPETTPTQESVPTGEIPPPTTTPGTTRTGAPPTPGTTGPSSPPTGAPTG